MQNDIVIKIVGWIVGGVGTILVFCGGLIGYIFSRHVKDNDTQFANNREDHKIIFERLNGRRTK
jgi:protein-S-isoprenylcysteine O-methyltransferase Ste14